MNNEELQEKFEELASTIDWIKTKLIDLLEEKGLAPVKSPYEVNVPEDIGDYYNPDEFGVIDRLEEFSTDYAENCYIRGLAFKTREEAEKYDKERILLFKLHKWAEEHNGGWTPNWKDTDEEKYTVRYDYADNQLETFYSYSYKEFSKLPYFISNDTAEQFIEEFREEIIEVLS